MSRILYIEAPFGISGDMLAGALLDMGADFARVQQVLGSLPVKGFHTELARVKKAGLDMCDFIVELDEAHENHDHDMEYLHGHSHEHEHHHHGEEPHEHHHGHSHDEEPHEHRHGEHGHCHHHGEIHHHHEHRGMGEVREILQQAAMTDKARNTALRIFQVLAQAEAKAHGTDVEHVHFHEVGAVDSIVDIVTIAVCLEDLQIDDVVLGILTEGTGTIRCQHGIMAVPVPAVTNIVVDNALKIHISDVQGELITPTGAAVAAAIRTADKLPKAYRILASGMGAGKREYEVPTYLRLLLVEPEEEPAKQHIPENEPVIKIETNIDDSSGEALGLAMEKLLAEGALDVFFQPIYMKKNRPAYLLTVLCHEPDRENLTRVIFQHTTSIGIRYEAMNRTAMEREIHTVELKGIRLQTKICRYGDVVKCYPEYESIKKLQSVRNIDYQSAYELIRGTVLPQNP